MNKLYLNLILLLLEIPVLSQSYVNVKKDTIVAKGELIIDNASKNTYGYLYNTGNGITKFKPIDASLDSMWSSNDTLYYRKGGVANYVVTSSVWKRAQAQSGGFFLFPSKNKFDKVMIGNNITAGWEPPSMLNVDGNTYLGGNVGVNINPANNYAISAAGNVGGISVSGLTDITAPNFNSFKTGWYLNFRDSVGGNFVDYQSNLFQSDAAYFYGNSVIGFNSYLRWGGVNGGGGYLKSGIGFNAGIDTRYNGNIKKYIAFHSVGTYSYSQQARNDYYAALEADSVVATTNVYGVNQHGSNAINNFEGSRFLLPKLPLTIPSGYKLSWNPSDGSVFVSTDGGGIGGVSPLTWQGALINSSNLTQRNVSNAGGNTFIIQNTDTFSMGGKTVYSKGTESVTLAGGNAEVSLKSNGLDMKYNPVYNLGYLNVNLPKGEPEAGTNLEGINIGIGDGVHNRGLAVYSLNNPISSGGYSRFEIINNSGGSGGWFMPRVRMIDINGNARFNIDGRGLSYARGDLAYVGGIGDGFLYTRENATGKGLNIRPAGIKEESTGADLMVWSSDYKTRTSMANSDYLSNTVNYRIYEASSYYNGKIMSDSGFINSAIMQWYGTPGYTLGIYSIKKGVLFPNLDDAAVIGLETSSIDNGNLDLTGRYVASSGNLFWNRDKNRFSYLYRLDATGSNSIGVKGTSMAAEGLPSNSIRTASPTETINLKYGSYFKLSITGDITFALSNFFNGTKVFVELLSNGSSHTVNFPAEWKWVGSMPTSLAANETGFIQLTIFDSSNIFAEYKKGT